MGVFNWISKLCPCGGIVEFQTKAIDGYGELDLNSVPVEAAKDLSGEISMCKCGKVYQARVSPRDIAKVPMEILEV